MNRDSDEEESVTDSLATIGAGGFLVSTSKVFALGFGLLTQIVMARLLTEAAYGEVTLTFAIIGVAHLIAKLGLDDGLMRELPHHEDDPSRARGVVRAGFVISIISGTTIGTIVFLVAPVIAERIFGNPSLVPLLRIAAVTVPFFVVRRVSVGLARGARDARTKAVVDQIVQPGGRLLFVAILVGVGFGAAGAVAGKLVAIALAAIVAVYLVYRALPTFDAEPVLMYRPVLAFSLPLIALHGIGFLNSTVDIYMVGYFLKPSSLGTYNITLQLGNMITSILGTAGFLLPPILTRLHDQDQFVEMRRTFQLVTKWMVILILPAVVVLFFAPKIVIGTLFGGKYTDGALALQILLVGKLFAVVMGLNGNALIALGKNWIVSASVLAQTVVNVGVNLLLIPVLGFEGAAIALALSIVVGDVIGVAVLYRTFGLHPFSRAVLAQLAAVGVVATVGYGVISIAGLPTAAVILVVGLAYLPIVVVFALEPEDERLFSRVEEHTQYDLTFVRRTVRKLR